VRLIDGDAAPSHIHAHAQLPRGRHVARLLPGEHVHHAGNVAVMAGHATLRRQVMGDDFRRTATPAESARLEALVEQEMRSGAFGLSSGLEYEVGSYASTEEVVAMARAAARHGGFYISHIRDEADKSMDAIREAIAVGEKARLPVQITHLKLGTVGVWGKAGEVIAMIDAARKRGVDVTADVYPYLAWSSNLKVLVPDKQWTNPISVKEALDDVGGGRNVQITRLPKFPQYVGKRLDEIAKLEGVSEVEMYIRIVQDEDAGVIGHTRRALKALPGIRRPRLAAVAAGAFLARVDGHHDDEQGLPEIHHRFQDRVVPGA